MKPHPSKARVYLRSLLSLRDVLEKKGADRRVSGKVFDQFDAEIREILRDLPDAVPNYDRKHFFEHENEYGQWYAVDGMESFIGRVIGRLQVLVEENEVPPGTRPLTFAFVRDNATREIIERDYRELQAAHVAHCWKSVLVLSGGCIEGILYDIVTQQWSTVKATATAKAQPDATKWTLGQLVTVSVDLALVPLGVSKLSPGLRDYRNLVHPGVELREKLTPGEEEATIALSILHMLHRDLS